MGRSFGRSIVSHYNLLLVHKVSIKEFLSVCLFICLSICTIIRFCMFVVAAKMSVLFIIRPNVVCLVVTNSHKFYSFSLLINAHPVRVVVEFMRSAR